MIGYQGPLIEGFDFAGIDAQLQGLQQKLSSVPSLRLTAFGRAFKQEEHKIVNGSTRLRIYYPETYQKVGEGKTGTYEPINMMPNDNLEAYSFFYMRDPAKAIDYLAFHQNRYIYKMSLVYWANIKKVLPGSNFRATEVLKGQLLDRLNKDSNVVITEIYESFENVFSNYTITEDYRQYMKPPYTAFRIDFDYSYREMPADCLPNQ